MVHNLQAIDKGYKNEIIFQRQMIRNLQRWQSFLSMIVGVGIVLTYLFRQHHLWLFVAGITCATVGLLLILAVEYAIYHGKKNLDKVIDQYAKINQVVSK